MLHRQATFSRQTSGKPVRVLKKLQTVLDIGDGEEHVTLGDRIDEIGFGLYQVHVFVLCSGFVAAEAAELTMAAGLVRAICAEFGVTGVGKSMLMTFTFLGFAFGTCISGPLGDAMGRRLPMLIGYLGILLSTVLTCLCTHIATVIACRFLLGIFIGIGLSICGVAMMEVVAPTHRGPIMAMMAVPGVIGEIWVEVGLCLFMPDLHEGSWRWLLGWAAVPAVVYVLFGLLSPVAKYDTPFWLGTGGHQLDLIRMLNLMAVCNGRPDLHLEDMDVVEMDDPATLTMGEAWHMIMTPPRLHQCLLMAVLCFAKDFALFGTTVFWFHLWVHVPGADVLQPSVKLLVTSMLGLPGCFLAWGLIWALPRRVAVSGSACCCGIAMLLLPFIESGSAIGYLSVGLFKLFFPTWQVLASLLPSEVFGTEIRGLAFATVSFFGRAATILSPLAVALGTHTFIVTLTVLSFMAGGSVLPLPETKDCELTNEVFDEDEDDYFSYGATLSRVLSERLIGWTP